MDDAARDGALTDRLGTVPLESRRDARQSSAQAVAFIFSVTDLRLATWLGMTNTKTMFLALLIAAAGCSTARPERIYDFAAREVTDEVSSPQAARAPQAARSPQAQLRSVLERLQPALARCTRGTSGTIDLTLHIAVDGDEVAVLDGAEVAYPDAAAADCVREVVAKMDLSYVSAHESAIWIAHAPFVVGNGA